MKRAIFYGQIENGRLHLDHPEIYNTWVSTLEGQRVEIEVKKESDSITDRQWGYLFACVYSPIATETGYTIEETDGMLKKMFLTRNKDTKKEYIKEKSKLNKAEISEFIDKCIGVAAGLGVVCLPANKFWRQEK